MAILRFRIYWEDDDSVYRDIVIKHSHTFSDLHHEILRCFEFDNKHKATFYRSNDKWQRGKEITLEKYDKQYVKEPLIMSDTTIGSEIKDTNQKFIYVYDFNNNEPGVSKYVLVTPWRVVASGSYVFREVENVKRQRAFITADIEYVNYKSSAFSPMEEDDIDAKNYYDDLNDVIDQQYKGAFNFRVGGELKFNTIMMRLGGAYYGNPYKTEKADRVKLAGGLGYRDKGFFIDLTYVYAINKDVNYPYRLQDKPNDPASVKNNTGNIVATIGFKL